MKPVTHIRLRGLVTGRGLLGAPEGALQVADDVVSLLPGTIEPRKGYKQLQAQVAGTTYPAPGDASGVAYGSGQVVQLRKQGADHVLALHDPGAGTSSLSSPVMLHPEGGLPMRSMGRRAYACTGAGVQVVEDGAAKEAGIPQAIDILGGTGTGTLLPSGGSVRYRVVYGDGTNWGAPSGPVVVTASGGSAINPVPTFSPDPSLQSWWRSDLIVRIYRSEIAASGIAPSDELFLVYEGPLPAPDAFGRRWVDTTPDGFLGAPLYTNAETGDGLGLAGGNLPPPLQCSDVASWEARAWYAIHADNEPWLVSLVGVDGLTVGDVIHLQGFDASGAPVGSPQTLTAVATQTVAGAFFLYSSGTPSENVEFTARGIVRAIGLESASIVTAWYVSGSNDAPGMMALRLTPAAVAAGIVRVVMVVPDTEPDTVPGMFSPRLPYTATPTSTDAQVLLDDSKPGRVRWSKPGQPEAVPALQELLVGDAREPIIGMVALRDGIVVAKTDGLYLVYGSGGMYGVQLIDASVRMASSARRGGRGTVQELNNEVYLHASDQRVYACSASGARAVDTDVQDLLRHREALFAAVDERDGLYCLYMLAEGTVPAFGTTDVAVFSMHARAWTRWTTEHRWASEHPLGGLVACSANDVLSVTRNDGAVTDYQDDGGGSSFTFQPSDDGGVTQPISVGVLFGDEVALVSDPSVRGVALYPRDGESSMRVLLYGAPFPTGSPVSVTVSRCIRSRVLLAPWHGGSPGGRKRFSFLQLHFDRYGLERVGDGVARAAFGGLGYQTPWIQTQGGDGDEAQTNIVPSDMGITQDERLSGWARMNSTPIQPRTVRVAVPKAEQSMGMLSVGLSTKQVNGFWRLSGVTLEVEQGEQKVSR